jgi:hypothetical protein
MKKCLKILVLVLICVLSTQGFSQVYSELGAVKQDTLEYNQLLPIFGKKVRALGFDLPHSAGLALNYIWQQSDITVSNVNVGFNNGPLYNVDELVRFNSTTSESNGINFRPDVWLFPFLNVYGIFAQARSTTNVDVGVYIPRVDGVQELFRVQTSPDFNTTSFGFGITPTAGFFGGWIVLDMNFTWTDVDALDKPVFVFAFDPRIGKTFKLNKPERNISFWVGGFRLKVNRDTNGSLPLSDIFPLDEWNQKVNDGQMKVGEAQIELDNWWAGLSPIEQLNPINIVKFEGNQAKLNIASTFLNGAENAIANGNNSTIEYNLDKKQKNQWNFVVGSQFQINKNYMIRAEYGFLSARQHFLCSLQYRFAL